MQTTHSRCYVSVAVLDNCLYAMGGFDGHVRQNTAEKYTPDTNQWSLITPMNHQRSDASAGTLAGVLWEGEGCEMWCGEMWCGVM